MNARSFFFGLLVSLLAAVSVAACTSSTGSDADCGPNACGACADGFVNQDRCVDDEWDCQCLPRTDDDAGGEGG